MIQQRTPSVLSNSYQHDGQLLGFKHRYPSTQVTRVNNIIRVTTGLRGEVANNGRESSMFEDQLSRSALSVTKIHGDQDFISQSNANIPDNNNIWIERVPSQVDSFRKTSNLSRSSKVAPHENVSNGYNNWSKNNLSDRSSIMNDPNENSNTNTKGKCTCRCCIVSLLIILLFVPIIVAILLALLLKSNQITPTTQPVLRWNSTGITIAGTGSPGNANNQFDLPLDVVLDYANNLYIVDCFNNRVQKYLFGASTGTTVAGNGTQGASQYQLNTPYRVILDSNESLYVSDSQNYRVQFWPKDGTSGTTVAGIANSNGSANNQLSTPYGIALNPTSGTLYISDFDNQRIISYTPGANSGTVVFGGVGGGTTDTQLYGPAGLYFDSFSYSLVIGNSAANNIVRYAFGASSWTLVAGDISGSFGATSTLLSTPLDMAFDPMGNTYVADRDNHRIQFFNAGQLNGTTIAGISGVIGNDSTTFNYPWSVRLDNQLNLYVVDAYNHRIQKFLRY